MKLLHLSIFAASVFAESDIFENPAEASSLLRPARSKRFLESLIGGTTDANNQYATSTQSYEEVQKQKVENFIETYHLTSVEAWGELKETMESKERKHVPEEKVDELESCVSSCKRRERWLRIGPGDKSIKEQKQNQEENYEQCMDKGGRQGKCKETAFAKKLIPCPKCFRYVPAVSGGLVDDIIGQVNPMELFKNVIG